MSPASFRRVVGDEHPCLGSGSRYSLSGIRISLLRIRINSVKFNFKCSSDVFGRFSVFLDRFKVVLSVPQWFLR